MSEGAAPASPFDGRMALWGNDDLLLTQAQRDLVEAEFPGALAAFDFPELRTLFAGFDAQANRNRRRRQRRGLWAIGIAGLGAALSATLPLAELLGSAVPGMAFGASAALSIGGLIWALLLAFADRHKEAWLEHRLRTERLRQFYFQLLLSNPELAARAMSDDDAAAQWHQARIVALRRFTAWLAKPMATELTQVIADVNQRCNWFIEAWRRPPALVGQVDLTDFLGILRRQRVGIQLTYVREKLSPGIGSPETRLAVAQFLSWTFTIATISLSVAGAVLLFNGLSTRDPGFAILASLIALLGVLSILVRVASEGLQLRGDTERYHWYREAVEEIDARFHDPAQAAQLAALREFETITYREMREFLKAHDQARFNFA